MALLGTHIRFALDLKDLLEIKDLDQFISGSIYPDSRYVTKINRFTTHDKSLLNKNFYQGNDFKKGWFTHLLCDQIQFELYSKNFPDLLGNFKIIDGQMSIENWNYRTGLKILQDLYDIAQYPIKNYLKHLEYLETPNNEDPKLIKSYNRIIIDMYQNDNLAISHLLEMWVKLGKDKKEINQLKKITQEMNLNENIHERIKSIYSQILDSSKDLFSQINL